MSKQRGRPKHAKNKNYFISLATLNASYPPDTQIPVIKSFFDDHNKQQKAASNRIDFILK